MKMKYYRLDNILKEKALYNIVIGERSNGKTYAVLEHGLKNYCDTGKKMAIVRRWQDDFRGKRGTAMFNNLVSNGLIEKYTDGEWSDVYYWGSKWYLCRYDSKEGKRIMDEKPFCYGFAISAMEHDKSTSYPDITTILFDEFLTRDYYLPDEFVQFMNVLSTIIRNRNDVLIFMCGNTVNQYSPYFTEMGLTNIKSMKPGTIDLYEYGDSGLRVAVEFSDSPNKSKPSNIYFAFDNPKLSMITGNGTIWEIDIYPHCPVKYKKSDVRFTYFIQFNGDLLQADVISTNNMMFTFIHRKTTDIQDPDHDLIYSPDYDPRPNHKRRITKASSKIEKTIASFYIREKVFYQDNEVGEIVRNYLQWCRV